MSQIKATLILFVMCCVPALAQNPGAARQEVIEQKFRAFDYDAVIELAKQSLVHADDYMPEILFQIYEMKAVAHYSKMEMTQALNSFLAILKIDPEHDLDPVKHSPKIISFYDEIKLNFKHSQKSEDIAEIQLPVKPDTVIVYRMDSSFKKLIYPSIVIPGSGQWLDGQRQKGMILTGTGAALLVSSIYVTLDCAQKEKDYLNANVQSDIDDAYASFNSSYKTRNALWAAYSLVWIYSQIDLFISHKPAAPLQLGLLAPSSNHLAFGFVLRANF
jgi:hypothetical protein